LITWRVEEIPVAILHLPNLRLTHRDDDLSYNLKAILLLKQFWQALTHSLSSAGKIDGDFRFCQHVSRKRWFLQQPGEACQL
jgi:hypothetical protein